LEDRPLTVEGAGPDEVVIIGAPSAGPNAASAQPAAQQPSA